MNMRLVSVAAAAALCVLAVPASARPYDEDDWSPKRSHRQNEHRWDRSYGRYDDDEGGAYAERRRRHRAAQHGARARAARKTSRPVKALRVTMTAIHVQPQVVWDNRKNLANEQQLSVTQLGSSPGNLLAPNPSPSSRHGTGIEATKNPPEAAFMFFLSQGWAEHQAAGIVGNLQAECGQSLNCSIGSGGLAQWRAERVTRFGRVFGFPFVKATFKDQLSYIQWELTHPRSPWKDSGRILKGAKDAASAALLFDVHYEKSSGGTRGARIANARSILKKYGGRPAS